MGKTQKFIFVTGGVLSGVGKGITAASMGAVLQAKGAKVSIQKCDPYLNVDAGLLDPNEHGEAFVTRDGAETDLDLGHYERFLDIELTRKNTTLSGRLLLDIITAERAGTYKGKTVQLVPHLTNAIQDKIREAAEGSDVHIVEIGGTVGDYESLSFIEAIREFSWRVGRENCLFMHVVYVPFIGTSKEFKTKPAQNALSDLRGFGIVPDGVIVRSDDPAPNSVAQKIALFGGIPEHNVQLMPNVDTVFRIPEMLAANGIHRLLSEFTGLTSQPDLAKWTQVVARQTDTTGPTVTVGLIAKYLDNEDTYLSVTEALKAAAWHEAVQLDIKWIDARKVTEQTLGKLDAVVVPGGSDGDGAEGLISVASYALEHNLPYLGIGLGLQTAVIAAARRGGVAGATSAEFDATAEQAVIERTNQQPRLGNDKSILVPDSQVAQLYAATEATERHRHGYEVNADYRTAIEQGGLVVSGTASSGDFVDYVEAPEQRYFVAAVANIEFRSRPYRAHPLFVGLIAAAKPN